MNPKNKIKELAQKLSLRFYPDHYRFLILTKKELLIIKFLEGCPDPAYSSFNKTQAQRSKNLNLFLTSLAFKQQLKQDHACVLNQKGFSLGLKIIKKIPEKELREYIFKIYQKIRFKNKKRITLISPTKKAVFHQILLHEFTHELLEDNNLRPKSWQWNEGLVTYLDALLQNKEERFLQKPKEQDPMKKIYVTYAHKWALLLHGQKDLQSKLRKTIDSIN